ncbi:Uncharacterized protein APZ42_026129 [Daphnia magna]|uniref:Uncharacterized protein n=1 Tax=Daphnia magna TaxID=35525 RepID=A0A164SHK5_9CRUS|nr:Uncharacterized protein APZ42_026129 [Daphnia magna]
MQWFITFCLKKKLSFFWGEIFRMFVTCSRSIFIPPSHLDGPLLVSPSAALTFRAGSKL